MSKCNKWSDVKVEEHKDRTGEPVRLACIHVRAETSKVKAEFSCALMDIISSVGKQPSVTATEKITSSAWMGSNQSPNTACCNTSSG